jgi:hypothetical protein
MSNSLNVQPIWLDTDTSTVANTNWHGSSGCTLAGVRSKIQFSIRGLNQDHNHHLKGLFKSAATTASVRPGPLQESYQASLAKDIQPTVARLTLARECGRVLRTPAIGWCLLQQCLNLVTRNIRDAYDVSLGVEVCDFCKTETAFRVFKIENAFRRRDVRPL